MADADPFHLEELDSQWLHRKPGAKWHRHGPEQLNAWVADMDWRPAPIIVDRLRRVLDQGDLGYPDWLNGSPMAGLFAERMAERFGWSFDPSEAIEFNDVVHALQVVLYLRLSRGDAIAYHVPAYPPFHESFESAGLDEVHLEGRLTEDGWRWDPEELRAACVANPKLKALLICNPQNPTGRCFSREELVELAEIAEQHNLLVISDEIHADLVYAPHQHIPFASMSPEAAGRTVTITAASKAFNVAGLRWAIAHIGPSDLRAELQSAPVHLFGTPNIMGVTAAQVAWTEGDAWLAAVMSKLDANRHALSGLLAKHLPDVRYQVPEATYLAWLDFRGLGWAEDPATVASRRGVELSPGPNFGHLGEGWARLNFATSLEMLERIVKRIARRVG